MFTGIHQSEQLETECCTMEELVASASMISNINILRHKIELTNFNEIEKYAERSIQAHMRKFVARTFQCNEKVLFHKPHAHGMVVVPNEVIAQLQGGYYHVKYEEGEVSHIVSLQASSLVPCTYIEAAGSTVNAKVKKIKFLSQCFAR